MLKYLPSEEMQLKKQRSNIFDDLRQYISDDCISNNDESNSKINEVAEETSSDHNHDYENCSCDVSRKLQ